MGNSNLNGVDLETMGQYVEAVKEDASNAKVSFVAKSEWDGGTTAKVTVKEFYANGQNGARADREFNFKVSEPGQLGGVDDGPNPVEMLAGALCGC